MVGLRVFVFPISEQSALSHRQDAGFDFISAGINGGIVDQQGLFIFLAPVL